MSSAKLRDEALANQIFQRDLLKWKLILCGGAFAFGFGITGSNTPFAYLSLCAVPISAVYCDLLISDADMRIATKAYFLRDQNQAEDNILGDYEQFLESSEVAGTKWWVFREIAVVWSSVVMSLIVLVAGILGIVAPSVYSPMTSIPLCIMGFAGIVFSYLIRAKTRAIRDAMIKNLTRSRVRTTAQR
ncbi:hypothetical protein U8335_03980 [Roseiconus lacunae]|uniref:Uncharacterized protein n=1 Tax=Roseiconus lacunae TaxID=2605694 RepID=A0ABT7PHK3_9BACT|nr:hypothetical protein [Roseiconus lacunae]MDM4015970.1 hypothetical protein [Roseiconus lacunae]WRQ51701.1 hypothetical protein U8335_03980 [Stieleria sp. HD01]